MMKRTFFLLLMCIHLGCNGAASPENGNSAEPEKSVKTDDAVTDFCNQFREALASRDWEALNAIHCSKGGTSAASLQDLFEPLLSEIGSADQVAVGRHREFDADSLDAPEDRRDIQGPIELLCGELEFYVTANDGDAELLLIAYLCKENGKIKILEYQEWSIE